RVRNGTIQVRYPRLSHGEFALCNRDVELIRNTSREPGLSVIDGALRHLDCVPCDLEARFQCAEADVAPYDIGDNRDKHRILYLCEGLSVVAHRFERAPGLAPKVALPSGIESADPGTCRKAGVAL